MLDEDDRRRLGAVPQAGQRLVERRRAGRIEVRRRFVEDEDPRPRGEHAGQRDALLLTAGESDAPPSREVRHAHLLEHLGHPRTHPLGGPRTILQAERDVVLDGLHHELGSRLLEEDPRRLGQARPGRPCDVQAGDLQRAPPGAGEFVGDETGEGQRERALARSRRAGDEQAGSLVELEIDLVQGGRRPARVAPAESARADHRLAGSVGQAGNPSRTPARRSAAVSRTVPPAASTTAEIAMNTRIHAMTSRDSAW